MDLKRSRPDKSSSETRNLHNVTRKFCLHCKTDIRYICSDTHLQVNDGSETTIKALMLLKNSTQQRIFFKSNVLKRF